MASWLSSSQSIVRGSCHLGCHRMTCLWNHELKTASGCCLNPKERCIDTQTIPNSYPFGTEKRSNYTYCTSKVLPLYSCFLVVYGNGHNVLGFLIVCDHDQVSHIPFFRSFFGPLDQSPQLHILSLIFSLPSTVRHQQPSWFQGPHQILKQCKDCWVWQVPCRSFQCCLSPLKKISRHSRLYKVTL